MSATCGTEKQLYFLLIGKTGQGKSATGNTILGQQGLFHEGSNMNSETQDVADKVGQFEDFSFKVVDCPGLMDTEKKSGEDTEAANKNVGIALGKCSDGVDAFILVINKEEKFTEEQRKTLEALKKMFGDKYLKNLIVVVTRGDMFQADLEHHKLGNITFHQWCGKQSGDFKKLFEEFNDRFLLVNNRERDPLKMDAQRREIIQLADTLRTRNGRYTSKCFEEAKALRDRLIVEENLPMLNESIQTKVGLLVTYLLKLKTTPSDTQRESIQQSVNALKKEIAEKDKGTGLLNHLLADIKKLETALHAVDELHRLAKKLENIRKDKTGWSVYGALSAGLTCVSGFGYGFAAAALMAAAPVAAGAAAVLGIVSATGLGFGVTQTVESVSKHENLSTSQKQIQAIKDALESKVEKVTKTGK